MPTGIRRFLDYAIHGMAQRVIYSMSMTCCGKVGTAWRNSKILKPQTVTTVVLVDPKDVGVAPKNNGEKIAMQVTKSVKRGIHVDPTVTIIMPLQYAIQDRL